MAGGTTTKIADCFTCTIVDEYVNLAIHFTQDISELLFPGMLALFMSLVSLWVVIQGIRLIITRTTPGDVAEQFIYVMIAAVLLGGQGSELVNAIFVASLQTMGAAASIALQVGSPDSLSAMPDMTVGGGLHALMMTAETAIKDIIGMGVVIASSWTITTPLQILYALILIVPYFILWIVYFAQVVVSIFRVMMLATLSPFMILGFGFGWGREMAKGGVRSLISSFIVLFSSTAVIGVLLYAIESLNIGEADGQSARDIASLDNVKFMLTVAMGWLGTAFMTEATGLANSITGSNFTNNAAATVVAGAAGTAMALSKAPGADALKGELGNRAGNFMGNAAYGAGAGAGHVAELIKKMKK